MTGKLTFLAGLGAGYVLGARAGRERYEQIAAKAQELVRDPRVQQTAERAQHLAQEKVEQAQQVVKDKVGSESSSSDGGAPSSVHITSSTGGTQS